MDTVNNALVVIPLSKLTYRFGMSAPLGYLFSDFKDNVRGVFSCELSPGLVKDYSFFIVELNWVTELYEFRMVARYIKFHNPHAQILFGGLFAQLHYHNIFRTCDVDMTIIGDAEAPIRALLSEEPLKSIPNLFTRSGPSPARYSFVDNEYKTLEYNLDWFPSYRDMLRNHYCGHSQPYGPLNEDEVNYSFPLIVTTKKCSVSHEGCDYCIGSKDLDFHGNARMDRDSLVTQLKQIERHTEQEYRKVCLYFLTDIALYDFRGIEFDLEVFIEYDGPLNSSGRLQALRNVFHSFRSGECRLPASQNGIHSKQRNLNYRSIVETMESPTHKVRFLLYMNDVDWTATSELDETYACRNLDVFDYFGKLGFDAYSDFNSAMTSCADLYAESKVDHLVGSRLKIGQ